MHEILDSVNVLGNPQHTLISFSERLGAVSPLFILDLIAPSAIRYSKS